jgi:hypothetical protein
MQDVEVTIQSQYAASDSIKALVHGFDSLIDPSDDIQLFYKTIFNVATAQGVGLDIWGRIVGVSRQMNVEQVDECFGFDGSLLEPWNQGIFYEQELAVGVYNLSDDAFRSLILWKALANIATADIATLNKLLRELFPQKIIFAQETGVMQIRITSASPLEEWERSILRTYGLFMKAAGVGFVWLEVPESYFGFVKSFELAPFGQAPFFAGSVEAETGV